MTQEQKHAYSEPIRAIEQLIDNAELDGLNEPEAEAMAEDGRKALEAVRELVEAARNMRTSIAFPLRNTAERVAFEGLGAALAPFADLKG